MQRLKMTTPYQETQRKILYITTGITIGGFVLYLICVCTSYWNSYTLPEHLYNQNLGGIWLRGHSGLWMVCDVVSVNQSAVIEEVEVCKWRHLFPTKEELSNPDFVGDRNVLDYYRSQSAFAVIGLGLMAVSHLFVAYSLRQTRYMFKRIVGCFHIMSAACILIVGEININSVEYERNNLYKFPPGTAVSFGFSFVTSWLTFAAYVLSALVFFICSRKRKHDMVPTEILEQNEPIRLGRL